jgi:signal peptidase II
MKALLCLLRRKTVTESEDINAIEPADMEPVNSPSTMARSWMLWIAAGVIVLDQLTKLIIETTLPLYESWEPIPAIAPIFRITHVSNTGVAFGLFPAGSTLFAWAAVVVSLVILVYNYGLPPQQKLLRLALGLQLGGALGNLISRVRIGHVTDFMDFGPWPVWNVADFSVVSGAILLAWLFWIEERKQKPIREENPEIGTSGGELRELADEPNILDEWSAS